MGTLAVAIGKKCQCVAQHAPSAYVPNQHHILPQSWGGPTVATNLIWLCPNTHTATHDLLNAYLHTGGEPGWEILQHYNQTARTCAAWAWAQRPLDRPLPYTTAHG